jgi:hypothetical protein
MKPIRRALTWLLAASLSYAGLLQGAQAALIGTEQAAAATAIAATTASHERLNGMLSRDDVAAALRARGVSPDQVRARVAALSDAEAAQLADQIDAAPAGGTDVLGTIVFVFVLLLITDILGLTKVFPFTRSVR